MAWVKKICEKYHSFPCDKTCCDVKFLEKFNVKKFWGLVDDEIRDDCYYSAPYRFVFEKTIYLNGREQTMLRIGLNPEDEFKISACFLKSNCGAFNLQMEDLVNLLQYLDANESRIQTSCTFQNSCKRSNDKVKLEVHKARVIKLKLVGAREFSCDENTLKTMCLSRNHIRRVITESIKHRDECIEAFFMLLHHFTFEKTMCSIDDMVNSNLTQKFFDEMIEFLDACASRKIVGEIGMNFPQYFEKCVPLYIRTKMLYESERLKTFRTWPHPKEHISIEALAKAGQFYTGYSDTVMCPFCLLRQSEWKSDDHPILEHFKHFSTCRFIRKNKDTLNVSDIGTKKDLHVLLSVLPYLGEDVVD